MSKYSSSILLPLTKEDRERLFAERERSGINVTEQIRRAMRYWLIASEANRLDVVTNIIGGRLRTPSGVVALQQSLDQNAAPRHRKPSASAARASRRKAGTAGA